MPQLKNCLIFLLLLNALMLAGCRSIEIPAAAPDLEQIATQPPEHFVPVQRYDRYTLVELTPEAAKQNLLLQIIDVDLPSTWSLSVGDALRYVLLRSGYQLCDSTPENNALFALPLPAAHLKLGPMVLRDVLQMLAGPAWLLQTDERLRRVCFLPSAGSAPAGNFLPTTVASETIQ
ncbi:UNVERIFIED_CONTAM: PilL N-terminal domain-containing protein [Pseudomonas sp. JL1]